VGPTGKIYVAGSTISPDFPVTNGVLMRNLVGQLDGFLAVISANGNQLQSAAAPGGA
jgi:hypothetical protein